MAYSGSQQLEKRLTRIDAKRRSIAKGAVYSVNQDGLIIARPRRTGLRFPLRGVFFAIAGLLMFKVGVLVALGTATYADRIGAWNDGTMLERAGAWVMTADPATQWVAMQVKLLLP
ncbi:MULTISPECIES: hypothetical protein [Pacificibacter]|uniref:hypothetical protein n=1 Tax=Pacificibacter TaxID=1042323 RepID=UPI001C082341|nr:MULTISPECIES: hypothetical protein [Pacificibacter]MBU2934856.1 hypothetical protein [Pacificibacter marinus]MDO6615831.1 hypothetical protein [Pacificibacter sp. 1_MG-2023]